jgi:hypothetical protein
MRHAPNGNDNTCIVYMTQILIIDGAGCTMGLPKMTGMGPCASHTKTIDLDPPGNDKHIISAKVGPNQQKHQMHSIY